MSHRQFILATAFLTFSGLSCLGPLSGPTTVMAQPGGEPLPWRRTVNGWELKTDWTNPTTASQTPAASQIHPSIVGLLVLMLSVGALLHFDPASSPEKNPQTVARNGFSGATIYIRQ